MNKTEVIRYLNDHASDAPTGYCARFIRMALQAGGLNLTAWPSEAKYYGSYLESYGFKNLTLTGYAPAMVDIVVIQPYEGGNPAGHIAMYNGEQWVSDFRQRDMWGGPGYRYYKPPYAIYRRCDS